MYERFNNYSVSRPRLRKTAGWFLVVIGFLALIAPVVPGAPLVFIGFELLGIRMIGTERIKRFIQRKRVTPPVVTITDTPGNVLN